MLMGIDQRRSAGERRGRPPAAKGPVRPDGHKAKSQPSAPAVVREPLAHARTCVGCRRSDTPEALVRLVTDAEGRVAVDPRGRSGGRGAWVHPTRECIATAVKRHAAERTLHATVQKDLDAGVLFGELRSALDRKVDSLLVVAARTRQVAVGAEAVAGVLESRAVPLLVVATDAGASSRALADEGADGEEGGTRVVRFRLKSELGRLFRRAEVALVALLDPRLAAELVSTIDRLVGLEDR